MTRDDIIRMAREAGLALASFCRWSAYSDDLERFAALVAAAEREECAKVAESYEPTCDTCPSGVANAIRARGET
jgi:hypothetical protein